MPTLKSRSQEFSLLSGDFPLTTDQCDASLWRQRPMEKSMAENGITDIVERRLRRMVFAAPDGRLVANSHVVNVVTNEIHAVPSLLYDEICYRNRTLSQSPLCRIFNTSHSASDSILPFSQEPCGHCDNCKREPADIKHADLTVEALKICDVVSHVNKMGGRVTLIQLGDLVRGIGTPMATIIRNTQAKKNSDDIECERPGYLLGPNLTKEKILLKKEVRLHCREVHNLVQVPDTHFFFR
ncbi:hypothetical protein H4Q26_001820 [Puccinia striiformis f. sp. tritici PST-130]|nr:hypothetical protein H4Q26_001820 [Puccinia striiformis f. sp. tritici PST-130]